MIAFTQSKNIDNVYIPKEVLHTLTVARVSQIRKEYLQELQEVRQKYLGKLLDAVELEA